jgi:hypothetical protein
MENLFEKNKSLLEKHCFNLEFENENLDFSFEEDKLVLIDDKNNIWQLQSQVDMELPITVWCDQFSDIANQAVIFVFGMGDYCYIEQLANSHDRDMIVVYEPEEKILLQQMYQYDLSDLFNNDNVIWVVGKNRRSDLCSVVDERIGFQSGFENRIATIPNYIKTYPEEYQFFYEKVGMAAVYEMVTANTLISTEEVRGKCYLNNLYDSIKQASIHQLIESFQSLKLDGIPAVVVAAGPSLDKNIERLKDYRDRVFVICVDSAIRTVFEHQIKPDLITSVDPQKPVEYFRNKYGQNVPMISHVHTNYEIVKLHKGRRFYSSDQGEYERNLFEKYQKDLGAILTGGTVANTAFTVVRELGFSTIILVGQDLAYPEKKIHAKATDCEYDIEEGIKTGKYFYVDGVDGDKILTEGNMCVYKAWFEEQIEKNPDINVIDATEGGALIRGAENMTLQDALEQNCTVNKYDFASVIENANYMLTPEEQEDAKKRFLNTFDEIEDVRKKLQQQQKLYEQLDGLNRKGKYNTNRCKKTLRDINTINDEMEDSSVIYLLRNYANQGEYELQEDFGKKAENVYDEVLQTIKIGQKLDRTYLDAADKLLKTRDEMNICKNN